MTGELSIYHYCQDVGTHAALVEAGAEEAFALEVCKELKKSVTCSRRHELGSAAMRVEADSIKYTFDSEVVEIKNVMIEGHPEEFRSLINLKEIPNFSPEIKHLTEEQPKPYIDLEALQRGMELFTGFAETWVINFDKDGEQPDRSRMTQDLAIHDPHEVLAFVYHCGGLIHACITVLRTPQQ